VSDIGGEVSGSRSESEEDYQRSVAIIDLIAKNANFVGFE